jgi:DNA-directed RNA polymerase subunit M/transcription elongation factor TFIIS
MIQITQIVLGESFTGICSSSYSSTPHGLDYTETKCSISLPEQQIHHDLYLYFYYRDKCGKSNAVNEKIIEHTMLKGNSKKKVNVAHKSIQTDKEEEKLQIDSADLTSDGMS